MSTINPVGNGLTGTTGTGDFVGATAPTITSPVINQVNDANGNEMLEFLPLSGAVNHVRLINSPTTVAPVISSNGTDSNIGLSIGAIGDAGIGLHTAAVSAIPLSIYSGTTQQHITNFEFANTSNMQTVTFPDATGTVSLLGNTSTGSGEVVLQTSPTLITPTLGAASATSINFGGSTLSNYVAAGSFTPTMTFASPGDLSVVYTTQSGEYTRIGNVVYYTLTLVATPTFTTASGNFHITSLPITVAGNAVGSSYNSSGITYPASTTAITPSASSGANALLLQGSGSSTGGATLTASHFSTGVQFGITCSGFYFV